MRLKNGVNIVNPILCEIKTRYLPLFTVSWYVLSIIESTFDCILTDDEVSISEHALVMGNKAIVKANKEFDPFSNVFAFNFEPTFISVFDKSFTSAQKVFFGDGDAFKELQKNVKMLELIPD